MLILCHICFLYICIIFLVSFEDKFYHYKTLPLNTSTSLNIYTVFLKINDILLYNHDLSVKKFNNWEYYYVICCPYSDFLSCLTSVIAVCEFQLFNAIKFQVPPDLNSVSCPIPEPHSFPDPHLCPFMALSWISMSWATSANSCLVIIALDSRISIYFPFPFFPTKSMNNPN